MHQTTWVKRQRETSCFPLTIIATLPCCYTGSAKGTWKSMEVDMLGYRERWRMFVWAQSKIPLSAAKDSFGRNRLSCNTINLYGYVCLAIPPSSVVSSLHSFLNWDTHLSLCPSPFTVSLSYQKIVQKIDEAKEKKVYFLYWVWDFYLNRRQYHAWLSLFLGNECIFLILFRIFAR